MFSEVLVGYILMIKAFRIYAGSVFAYDRGEAKSEEKQVSYATYGNIALKQRITVLS